MHVIGDEHRDDVGLKKRWMLLLVLHCLQYICGTCDIYVERRNAEDDVKFGNRAPDQVQQIVRYEEDYEQYALCGSDSHAV